MDRKSIRNIIGLFSCIIILGCLSTFITKSVIGSKKSNLYEVSSDTEKQQTSEVQTDTQANSDKNNAAFNKSDYKYFSKEEYLEAVKLIENQVNEVWENVTESNNALSAAKYEKGVWDEQLNKVYELYMNVQSQDNKEKLKKEQSAFETEREKLSISAAKNASEALDGLSYIREYVRLTKEKTYDYIDRYFLED